MSYEQSLDLVRELSEGRRKRDPAARAEAKARLKRREQLDAERDERQRRWNAIGTMEGLREEVHEHPEDIVELRQQWEPPVRRGLQPVEGLPPCAPLD